MARVFGIAAIALADNRSGGSFNFTDQEAAGLVIMGGGFVIGELSLIALIARAIYDVPPSRTPFRPTPDPTQPTEHCGIDGSCVPIGPRPPPQQPE